MYANVYLGDSEIGKGIFASRAITRGETIFYVSGSLMFRETVLKFDEIREANVIQIGVDRYIDPGFPGVYINHSCDPNAGVVDETRMIAIRDILKNEEVRYDYSTTMSEDHWTMDCRCGESSCRGTIGDFVFLPTKVQKRYQNLGIVPAYILEILAGR